MFGDVAAGNAGDEFEDLNPTFRVVFRKFAKREANTREKVSVSCPVSTA